MAASLHFGGSPQPAAMSQSSPLGQSASFGECSQSIGPHESIVQWMPSSQTPGSGVVMQPTDRSQTPTLQPTLSQRSSFGTCTQMSASSSQTSSVQSKLSWQTGPGVFTHAPSAQDSMPLQKSPSSQSRSTTHAPPS